MFRIKSENTLTPIILLNVCNISFTHGVERTKFPTVGGNSLMTLMAFGAKTEKK